MSADTTDFGFEEIPLTDKTQRVNEVFTSVSPRYDLMNDLMSMGLHRLWKRFAVHLSGVRAGDSVLDVAGGTGDMAILYLDRAGDKGEVILTDINRDMLQKARSRLYDRGITRGIRIVQANAENLPFPDNRFDCINISFGLRNITDKPAALRSMYAKLKYGGKLVILEFSSVVLPRLRKLYDNYSFHVIPMLGKLVAGDEDSYRYLVESIRMHPDQETLKQMLESGGFGNVKYHNLSGGIVAVHIATKV